MEIKGTTSDFESELRISSKLLILVLALLAFIVQAVSASLSEPTHQFQVQLFAVLLYALAALSWLFDHWKPLVGRWFIIITLVTIVRLADIWQDVPGTLALMAIPTGLAAALISLPAAIVTALGETVLLLLLPRYVTEGVDWAAIGVALTAIWGMLGVMCAVYRPVHRVARWSWDYYQRAQDLLEEARDRQVELKQALDDLAHANLQLKRLNTLAQALRQAAEDARRAKEQFVANVSHELRTPLNMVIGFSEMIIQAPETYGSDIPAALLADLAVIHRNAEHLSDLIDDVLDLSQIEAGQMALTKEHVPLHEIIEAAATAVRPLFDSKGLYLRTEVPEDLPPIFCDRTRIREVVLNLLSNAGRFTERGGVRVRAWQKGDDVIVSVADTGPGIAARDVEKIFQPFQQVDGSIRRRYGGSGLGLAISRRFIELHGGRIWVETQEGRGTTFFFRLPVSTPRPIVSGLSRWLNPQWEYVERPHRSMAPVTTLRPRFVVLEAGDSLKRLLTRYLDSVEIVSVGSLEEALGELADAPAQALLVNDMSVGEALRRLNQSAALPYGVPVIVCSVPGAYEAADTLGVSDYLVKPVSRDALLAALDRLNLRGGTILIVDDEPEALRLFRRMLASSGRGYRVLRAGDGQEAMNILRRERPDVILLDLIMPNMDGFQLLEAKSQDPALRDIPVVVISARDPAGQPIVSKALAVTRGGGLSVPRLLACVEAITRILSTAVRTGDQAPLAKFAG